MKKFYGYRRSDGSIGVRNHVIVLNTVGELSGLTRKIAKLVSGVTPVIHYSGATNFPEDQLTNITHISGDSWASKCKRLP